MLKHICAYIILIHGLVQQPNENRTKQHFGLYAIFGLYAMGNHTRTEISGRKASVEVGSNLFVSDSVHFTLTVQIPLHHSITFTNEMNELHYVFILQRVYYNHAGWYYNHSLFNPRSKGWSADTAM